MCTRTCIYMNGISRYTAARGSDAEKGLPTNVMCVIGTLNEHVLNK